MMQSDEKAEKEFNSKELQSTTVDSKGLSNQLIGKSHLGDFGRSLGVFGFYQVMLLIILLASDASYEAAAVLGFLWGIGIIFSIPAALIFFGILFFESFKQRFSSKGCNSMVFCFSCAYFGCLVGCLGADLKGITNLF